MSIKVKITFYLEDHILQGQKAKMSLTNSKKAYFYTTNAGNSLSLYKFLIIIH
jgi:hypothetical protein